MNWLKGLILSILELKTNLGKLGWNRFEVFAKNNFELKQQRVARPKPRDKSPNSLLGDF